MEIAEAGVTPREESDGDKEMEVDPEETIGSHPVLANVQAEEEIDEEEDPEEAEEDPEETEKCPDEGEGNEEEAVLAVGLENCTGSASESEKAVLKQPGDDEKAMSVASMERSNEDTKILPLVIEDANKAVKEDEEPCEVEDEPEEMEEEGMEDHATKVSGEDATMDDMNRVPAEEPKESEDEGTHGANDKDGDAGQLIASGDAAGYENGGAQSDEFDPLLLRPVSVENAKDVEIFVGGLPKDCGEEDIAMVFSQYGGIECIRIIKHTSRKKSRCIAFVCYANTGAAKKALAEFKEGTEVKGKMIKVSASQHTNTLYLGNIPKIWTKDQVLTILRGIGIEEFDATLPDDPDTGGRNRGFAFLKFATHDSAEAAFQQLKQPDALSGNDISVKESARTPTESSEDLTMEVKTVYLDHVPLSWDKRKVEECSQIYGKIQRVRILKKAKKKTSFVEFLSRKDALACVEGINNAKLGGDVMLVASLARPPLKVQMGQRSPEGLLKVQSGATSKDAVRSIKKFDQKNEAFVEKKLPTIISEDDASKLNSQVDAEVPQTSNPCKGKRKAKNSKSTSMNERPSKETDQKNEVSVEKKSPNKLSRGKASKLISQVDAEVPQTSNHCKGKRKSRTSESTLNERPLKKSQKTSRVPIRPSKRTRYSGNARAAYGGQYPSGPRTASTNQAYHSVGAVSKPSARDLEPHAGCIPLADRVPSNHAEITYSRAASNIHRITDLSYTREIEAPEPVYYVYRSNPQYQGGYVLRPPPQSGSYNPRSGAYSPERRYY